MFNPKSILVLGLGCGCAILMLFIGIALFFSAVGHTGLNLGVETDSDSVASLSNCDIPEPYKTIFDKAGQNQGTPPALIAAIFYAGEHAKSWPDPAGPWARPSTSSAKGPFQFTDPTWSDFKMDGNGDGKKDVEDLTDAAFAAAKLLGDNIKSHKSRGEEGAIKAAIERYGNQTEKYLNDVYTSYSFFTSCSTSPQIADTTIGSGCGSSIISQAAKYAGIPYSQPKRVCASKTSIGPRGVHHLDCSSFVGRVYNDVGLIRQGQRCFDTAYIGGSPDFVEISAKDVRPGDIVRSGFLFGRNGKRIKGPAAHVVIYVKGDVTRSFYTWQSGGDRPNVHYGLRSAKPNQQYYRAKVCGEVR